MAEILSGPVVAAGFRPAGGGGILPPFLKETARQDAARTGSQVGYRYEDGGSPGEMVQELLAYDAQAMDYWTAFILGLVGSLHCAGMCGPLALALPTAGRTGVSLLAGRAAYTAGRIATYCSLGVVFGLAGRTMVLAGIQRWVSIALGLVLLAGLFSSRKLALWRPLTTLLGRLQSTMAALLHLRSLMALGLLGLLNGLLPCGLVYVACAGAIATGAIGSGAGYMLAFGLGTAPLMLALSLSGRLLPMPVRLRLRAAVPVSVFLLGALLILRGMALGIPYLSPDLAGGAGACCHP